MPNPSDKSPQTTPGAVETIRIKVDGREIEVPRYMPNWEGKLVPTTMLQACQLAGVEIPHYCYHPKLPVAGNCRMCLVEYGTPVIGPDKKPVLDGNGKPIIQKSVLPYEPQTPRGAIACATPISPGMEIYPSSPATKQMREAVLEFLLLNHPLDCPICDQAGECQLQEYSLEHGQAASRFVETKVHKPKQIELGPRIIFDAERCILCSRCIRFTQSIARDDALGIMNRGSFNTITVYPGKKFDNNYTLNTVDICPVGALTSKDFRFQMRVWFLKESPSICASCGTGCNILVGSRQNRIFRFVPRQNDAVNSCWMCDTGRLNYKWVGRPDRLARLRAPNSSTTPPSWRDVLDELAGRLSQIPAGATAIIASARQTNEELFLLRKLADKLQAITESVERKGEPDFLLVSADRNPNSVGARLTGICGIPMGGKLPRIADGIRSGAIQALLVFGEDPTRHGINAELLGQLKLLVASDILPNATTNMAHYLLPGCAHLEKRGSFVNVKGRWQKFMPAVTPLGDARPEWEFLNELVGKITGQPPATDFEALFKQMSEAVPEFRGLTWDELGETGVNVNF